MKLLCIQPGASYSTADVFAGYWRALEAQGHDLLYYGLDQRLDRARSWLRHQWRQQRRVDPALVRPTPADMVYQASVGAVEAALRNQPDGAVIFSGMYFHPDALIMLRRAGVRTALVFTESPYDAEKEARVAPLVDICFTNERASVGRLRLANPETHYLPHAHDPACHHPGPPDGKHKVLAHDVVFIGSYFAERVELLSAVDWSGIDLGLYGETSPIPSRSRLRQYIAGGLVSNDRAAALYKRAKIVLNLYRSSIGFGRRAPRLAPGDAESLNPRAYELAACGVFHISDWRAEVDEILGGAVPTFSTPGELGRLVRRYLAREDRRRALAARLPALAAPHTYAARATVLAEHLSRVWQGCPIMHAALAAGG